MGGGLMQLVAYGAQDIYLTGNPQITFFKVVYRRHTNFSMEHIQQTFKGTSGNNARVVATVARNGDLIHDCFLKIKMKGGAIGFNPGHNILDNVEVEIGGQMIDRQYGHFMEARAELTEPNYGGFCGDSTRDLSVGQNNEKDVSPFQYTAGAGGINVNEGNGNLYVPLQFWFCRHVGLSLPLIALQYHEVNINVTFTGVYTGIAGSIEPQLWVNYIYLDTDERRRFAQVSHEYLIEQVQTQEFSWSDPLGTNQTFKLNFNHPVKELIWAATNGPMMTAGWGGSTQNTTAGSFDDFATADTTMKLRLNGHDRFASQEIDYFTRYQPYEYHENLCRSENMDQIGVYSFALKPEEHQPSGTCNFSRIDSAEFELTNANVGSTHSITLQMYAINYNVLRIMSGMGGLAYSN